MRLRLRDLTVTSVVVGLFLSLAALTLVARRETSRKTQCETNLRRLALACLSYEFTYGSFPPAVVNFSDHNHWISTGKENGMTLAGPNWALAIMCELGDIQLDRQVNKYLVERSGSFNVADDIVQPDTGLSSMQGTATPEFMVCPAATRATLPHSSLRTQFEHLTKGNYAACIGSGTYLEGIDGSREVDDILKRSDVTDKSAPGPPLPDKRGVMTVSVRRPPVPSHGDMGCWQMGRGQGVKRRKIVDGVSKTVMLSELLTVDGNGHVSGASDDIRGAWLTASMGGSTYSHKTTPNSTVKDQVNGCETDAEDLPIRSRLNCVEQIATGPTAGDTFAAARSQHRGGVSSAMADGSVKFYSNDIDPDVWAARDSRRS